MRWAPEQAARLRRALLAALATQSSTTAPSGSGPRSKAGGAAAPPESSGRLEPEYIRDAVADIKPLLGECYALARAQNEDLGAGKVVVEFGIIGDEELGGVIETSAIADDTELVDPILHECVRETMYAVELPKPMGSGKVKVRYPFVFEPAPDE